jgi:hypothetical protein
MLTTRHERNKTMRRSYSIECPRCARWTYREKLADGAMQRRCTSCEWHGRIVRDVARCATAYAERVPEAANENKDCSVRAHAVAACVSYAEAHALYAKHGRAARCPTSYSTTYAAMREVASMELGSPRCTIAAFVKARPVGHYVVHVSAHALAIVDGVVHDWGKGTSGARRQIRAAWRLDV